MAPGALFLSLLTVVLALHWPLPLHLRSQHVLGAFHAGHVWCFDHIARMVTLQEPWALSTGRIGFPLQGDTRFIAWAPALLAVPLRPLLGPLGAYNAVLLLAPAFSGLAAWALFRRLARVESWVAAGAAAAFALCPYALGSLANGQVAKFNLWILPVYLLAFHAVTHHPRRLAAWLGLASATLIACFTSPSTALFIPLAAGLWSLGRVVGAAAGRVRALLLVMAILGVTAVSMLPSWAYYMGATVEAAAPFEPGPNIEVGTLPVPSPMAQPDDTFLGSARREFNPELSNHVTFLTFPLLALAMVSLFVRFRGRALAWGAVLLGVLVAHGPRLAMGDAWVRVGGHTLALPARLLDLAGYPLQDGGMYYRAIALASLGLAGLLAGLCGRIRRPWGALLAWCIGFGAVADGIRVTLPLWPRQTQEIPGREVLDAMAADESLGAVLDLPLQTSNYGNETHLLAAVFHGRATTAIPTATALGNTAHLALVRQQVEEAFREGDSALVRQRMFTAGYRYAVWRPFIDSHGQDFAWWARRFGFPRSRGPLRYWVFGPPP